MAITRQTGIAELAALVSEKLREKGLSIIDFSPPPAAIGEERITDASELKLPSGRVKLYTPTQSVMDRLSAYYHFGDPQGLEQALLVAAQHPVDLAKVKDWSDREKMGQKFADFERRLRSSNARQTDK